MANNKVYIVLLYDFNNRLSALPVITPVNSTIVRYYNPAHLRWQFIVILIRFKICDDNNPITHIIPQRYQVAQNPLYTSVYNGMIVYSYCLY